MFERFTDRARRVVVIAQEEARLLDHSEIGTEHLLLALCGEGEGVSAVVLDKLGINLDVIRQRVKDIIGEGGGSPAGHMPFTPRSKRVLELSLREALTLGHNYIGTEHILLGLIREGEGVGCQVLVGCGLTLEKVRLTTIKVLAGYMATEGASAAPLPGTAVESGDLQEGPSMGPLLSVSDLVAVMDEMSPRHRKATISYLRAWYADE